MPIPILVGKRGTIVIPAKVRKQLGIQEGSLMLLDVRDFAVSLRPAAAVPVEEYTPERKAEFLLNSAVDDPDYERAREIVRGMGLDPDSIRHERPFPGPSAPDLP